MSHFRVNCQRKVVYCPQGKRRWLWKNSHDSYGQPIIRVEFRQSHCSACPFRYGHLTLPRRPRKS